MGYVGGAHVPLAGQARPAAQEVYQDRCTVRHTHTHSQEGEEKERNRLCVWGRGWGVYERECVGLFTLFA